MSASTIVGLAAIATAGDRLTLWTQFLNPLIQSKSECLDRVLLLNQEHTLSKSLYFTAYFNVLPTLSNNGSDNEVTEYLCKTPQITPFSRTFCSLPHYDDKLKHVEHHFRSLPSPLQDEIEAHMSLFDRQVLGDKHYCWLLEHVSQDIIDGLSLLGTNQNI